MTPILRALTALASPAGPRSRLSVFYFHRVLAEPDPLLPGEPDARSFDEIVGWVASQFRILDPVEACDRLFDGSLPSRPAVITFDDGYRDNYTVALPVLQRHGVKAAFFVATGFLQGGMMFNDRVIEAIRRARGGSIAVPGANEGDTSELPLRDVVQRRVAIDAVLRAIKHMPPAERLQRVEALERDTGVASPVGRQPGESMMMTPDQVAALRRAGMTVGGHTRTHPILLSLPDAAAQAEISGGLDDLASILGERPSIFAYPNGKPGGDFDERHVAMVRHAGCRYAFTTRAGVADRQASAFELPRFTPWDRERTRFGVRALRNLMRR